MACMALRAFASLVVSLVLGASLAGQHTPAPGEDPRGVVLDEDARPIAGAAVSLQWEEGGAVPFGRAIALRLQRSPLPATQSGRDGSWVLPLTNEQRQMGAPGFGLPASGCWLVVEKDGYLPWREPIPAGLPSYLGSRVLLRRVRADDEFAELPWPPAVVAVKTESGFAPWLAPGEWNVTTSRRGGRAGGDGLVAVDVDAVGRLDVTVTAVGAPLPRVQLWFDDGAFALPAGEKALPTETDADGRATARVPAGKRALRATAPGFLPADLSIDVARLGRVRTALTLVAACAVDVLAIADGGVPVPFRKLDIVPHSGQEQDRRPFVQFSDAQGRARVFVDDPAAWFAYSDRQVGGGSTPVDLDRPVPAARGVVEVVKDRAVTVRLRGDEWPAHGELRWETGGAPATERAFKFAAKDAPWVVCRLCFREIDVVTIGGDHGVPFRIRREDLPPMPSEPLLDLVALDRRVRTRAELLQPAEFAPLLGFLVQPPWQSRDRGRSGIDYARQHDGRWWLMSRDDAPFDAVATAARMKTYAFRAPAAVVVKEGGELPRVELPMVRL